MHTLRSTRRGSRKRPGAKADREACNLTVEVDEVCVSDNQIQEAVNALGRYELEIL